MDGDWRNTFPGIGAAEKICTWIDNRLAEINGGRHSEARDALVHKGWERYMDTTGVPQDVCDQLRRWASIAADALREPVQLEAASAALYAARNLVVPGLS